jgi:hypothetical protein
LATSKGTTLNPQYPHKKFTIRYNSETKTFYLLNKDGDQVGEDRNGRELARDAWEFGAEEVCYDYDLGLDERLQLKPLHEKNKSRS